MHNTIREERTRARISQAELAEKAGVSRPFLSNIENGSASPTIKTAKAIASALGKTLNDIFPLQEDR